MQPGKIIIEWDSVGQCAVQAPVQHPQIFKILADVLGSIADARTVGLVKPRLPAKIENRS